MSLPWMLGNGVPLWKRGTGAIAYGAHGNPVYRSRRVLRVDFAGTAYDNLASCYVASTQAQAHYSFSSPSRIEMTVDPSVVTGREWLDNQAFRWFWASDPQTADVFSPSGVAVGSVTFRLYSHCDGFWDGSPATYTYSIRSMILSVSGDVDAGDLPRSASYHRYAGSTVAAGDGMPHPYAVTMQSDSNNRFFNHGEGYFCVMTLL